MRKVLVDTNILIDHVRGKGDLLTGLFQQQIQKKIKLYLSTVSVFEFLSGLSVKNKNIHARCHRLLDGFCIEPVNMAIAERAAALNRGGPLYGKIGTADLLIAATAIELSVGLITKNIKDFKQIKELKIQQTDS